MILWIIFSGCCYKKIYVFFFKISLSVPCFLSYLRSKRTCPAKSSETQLIFFIYFFTICKEAWQIIESFKTIDSEQDNRGWGIFSYISFLKQNQQWVKGQHFSEQVYHSWYTWYWRIVTVFSRVWIR